VSADSGDASDRADARAPAELRRSAARGRGIAFEIRDNLMQELAADALSLEAAALCDVAAAERETLEARGRTVAQCARMLAAVAEQLESTTGAAPAATPGDAS
jgi:hypothetical protein